MDKQTRGGSGKARTLRLAAVAVALFGCQQQGTPDPAAQQSELVDRAADEWDRYSRCLLGAPLAAGELASRRFRNIVLAAPAATDGQPAWPERCDRYREALANALQLAEPGAPALSRLRTTNLSFPHPRRDTTGTGLRALDRMWNAAAEAKLPARDGGEVPLPPAPAHPPFLTSDLPTVSPDGFVLEDHAVGNDALDILGSERLCRFTATGDAISARCGPIKRPPDPTLAELKPVLLYGDRADQPPLVSLYGEPGGTKQGALIHPWDGTLVYKGRLDDAHARGGGAYDILVQADGISLQTIRPDRPTAPIIKVGDGRTAKLIDDWVLWIAASGRVYAAKIADAGIGKPIEVGPFNHTPTNIHYYCALADGTRVVQVLGEGRNLVFLKDGVWSAPRHEPGLSGTYVCAGDTVSMAWTSWPKGGERSIHRATCTVDACQRSEAPFVVPEHERRFMSVLPIGDKVLAVLSNPDHGGLRYRLAELEQLASAPEVLIHDESEYGGPLLGKYTLHPIGGRTLLVYGTGDGLRGLEFSADGTFKAVAPAAD